MKIIITAIALILILATSPAIAHHPAADMVDADIYAMINEMVSDTPHATMVFDEDMGTTTITEPSVSDAEDAIDDYLLAAISLVDAEDVTITITFEEVFEAERIINSVQTDHWQERDDWGVKVIFTINTLLCIPENYPDMICPDITDENFAY